MGDTESNQPSKKRAAGVQLSRDNPGLDDENDDACGIEAGGTFKRASEEVLATRRIVKVRRQQIPPSASPSAPAPPASNPFATIQLVPPSPAEKADEPKSECKADEPIGEKSNADEERADVSDEKADKKSEPEAADGSKFEPNNVDKDESDGTVKSALVEAVTNNATEGDNKENECIAGKGEEVGESDEKKENGDKNAKKNMETASFNSFQQLSSGQNAFSGLAGTGFSSSSFSFGLLSKDGSSTNSLFGGFTSSNIETPSIFGNSSAANASSKNEGSKFPPLQEVSVETGEENETAVFTGDSVLFEFIDGGWKERGKGELKVNVSTSGAGKARLVMRARGNYRLILNASLFPDMKLTNMDKKGVTFACINSAAEGKDGLSTIALKFRDVSIVEDFKAAVMEHKCGNNCDAVGLKTPENSPKAE